MKYILVILFFCSINLSYGQTETDIQLAQYYYTNGEFDKASMYYEKLYATDPSKVIFTRYFECLMEIQDFKTAEKVIKKQANANKADLELQVTYAQFYEEVNEGSKAKKIYEEILESVNSNPGLTIQIYQAFIARGKVEYAKATLDKGRKLAPSYPFNFQYADYYSLAGNKPEMMREYIDYLELQPSMKESIQLAINSRVDLSKSESVDFVALKELLIGKTQKQNAPLIYSEMLIWLFVQNQNFNGALIQAQSIDKRIQGDGSRVYDLGLICVENKANDIARKCFDYVISLGSNQPLYFEAQKSLLNTRFIEITTNRAYSEQEISATIQDYKAALERLGKSRFTFQIILELSHIKAFYGNQIEESIQDLTQLLQTPGLTDMQRAQVKMQLADVNVLGGDIWEASLLYMQVDTDFKFEPIGNEAKYKNARVFYFDGEFDFAQGQLGVLKESTSKIIANDALQLSVMITDNYGLDSNYQVMMWFATAERLIEQHRYDSAFVLFDSIQINFPMHSLADEILFRKGKAMEQQGKWVAAAEFYNDLLKFHSDDILGDDALFRLADMEENQFQNKEKALEYYKRLVIDFKGSLFSTEARNRIRILRGDANIDTEEL
ncbi:MAG: tetratricopeptide repeat protein [Crocinitomicaceae bacterium]|jgi:tetratricopeptide (TPR) repeat protein|nr:tetratricopeptide repeat protein [Crocinitomicaceae bacterium]